MRKTFIPLLVIPAILPAADISPSCATGTVTASVKSYYIISCGSNRIEILKDRAPGLTPGDRILLPPRIHPYASPDPKLDAFVLVGHEPLPPPPLSILQDIDPARTDKQRVRIRGWIKDSDYDPLDKNWMRLVLKSGRETIDVAVPIPPNTPFPPKTFRFSTIEVIGLYRRMIQGGRLFATASIEVSDPSDITILHQPDDLFDQPPIDGLAGMSATEILSANACSATGVVAATWGRRSFLLRTKSRTDPLVRVDLTDATALPRYGDPVQAVGIVQTDLHHIRLTDALFRPMDGQTNAATALSTRSPSGFCTLTGDNTDVYLHGQSTCVTGTVQEVLRKGPNAGLLRLTAEDLTLQADISSLGPVPDGLDAGSTIALTAVCIAETDAWRPGENLANYRGTTLVPQTVEDLRILARPPWWTPGRLLTVIFALAAVLIFFSIWNRLLMSLAKRRGHELFRSEYARASAVLRISERTRLATELHDSLSQSIAGIACQVVAAKHALTNSLTAADERLSAAENMLASCRNELSNCLFDLRGDMLEETDFSTAIRKSLSLVAGAAEHAAVRMNIPRSHLHDATAHAILCIIRELVSNALRHGKAAHVQVAGCIDGGCVRFSVTDDGTGFDETRCPGPLQGHFGLTGIRDRVRRLKGTMTIEANAPHGTRIILSLPMPANTQNPIH